MGQWGWVVMAVKLCLACGEAVFQAWHASVCHTPKGDTPICVKTLFLRFLTPPVTWKLETAEANVNEYVNFHTKP